MQYSKSWYCLGIPAGFVWYDVKSEDDLVPMGSLKSSLLFLKIPQPLYLSHTNLYHPIISISLISSPFSNPVKTRAKSHDLFVKFYLYWNKWSRQYLSTTRWGSFLFKPPPSASWNMIPSPPLPPLPPLPPHPTINTTCRENTGWSVKATFFYPARKKWFCKTPSWN